MKPITIFIGYIFLFASSQVHGEGFLTDPVPPEQAIQEMKRSLNLQGDDGAAVSKSGEPHPPGARRVTLIFAEHRETGILALPAHEVQIHTQQGIKRVSLLNVKRIQFLTELENTDKKAKDPEEKRYSVSGEETIEISSGEPRRPIPCRVSLQKKTLQGLCSSRDWITLTLKSSREKYRAIMDHCFQDCIPSRLLKAIKFHENEKGTLGGLP